VTTGVSEKKFGRGVGRGHLMGTLAAEPSVVGK